MTVTFWRRWWPWTRPRRPDPSTQSADRHLDQLRDQRAQVERLADALHHEQSNNHFRQRVEQALRRDPK